MIRRRILGWIVGFAPLLVPMGSAVAAETRMHVIEGVVRLADGIKPIAGASVWGVRRNYQTGEKAAFGPVLTNADGRYRLEVVTEGKWFDAYAGFEGYQTVGTFLDVPTDGKPLAQDFALKAAAQFEGKIQSPHPVSFVHIEAKTPGFTNTVPSKGVRWQGKVAVLSDGSYRAAITYADPIPPETDFYPGVESLGPHEMEPLGDAADFHIKFFAEGFEPVIVENVHLERGKTVSGISPVFRQKAAVVSGTVVHKDGKGLPNVPLQLLQRYDEGVSIGFMNMWPPRETATDSEGRFRFDGIPSGSYSVSTKSRGYRILFGVVGPFESQGPPNFTLTSEMELTDVRLVSNRPTRVYGRILNADGAPFTNAEINYRSELRLLGEPGGTSSGSGNRITDDTGNWEEYVDAPCILTYTVEHGDLEAKRTFNIEQEGGEIQADLTLGEPSADWIVNPKNGHSYALINIRGIEAAVKRAVQLNAHLVAINDAEEQRWLVHTFGRENFWIGLTDAEEEGVWKWMNGEPLAYTNWAENEPSNLSGEEDYVLMNWSPQDKPTGAWKAEQPQRWHFYKTIIEKASK